MPLSVWTRELGESRGRIAPANWTPTSGDYAFVLGSDTLNAFETLNVGDYIEASQTATFTNQCALLRVSAYIRPPSAMPSGLYWRLGLLVDAVEYAAAKIRPGFPKRRIDLAANVMHLATLGVHTTPRTVTLRLTLAVG
jgi:hypothetical protein